MAKLFGENIQNATRAGTIVSHMRYAASFRLIAALVSGAMLCACATQTQMITDSPGAPTATTQAQPNEPTPPPSPAAAPAAQPAGRAARAPTTPAPPAPAEEQPMTVTRAREQCWMQAESQRARDIDTRVKFVEQCVKDKMK